MITKFETSSLPVQQGGGKSSNTLLYVLAGAVVLFIAYQYVIKPQMDKKKSEEQK